MVIVVGTGEKAQTAAEYLLEQDAVIYGFLSENEKNELTEYLDIPVLGYYEDKTYLNLLKKPDIQYFIAVQDSEKRIKVSQKVFSSCQKHSISIIHPSTVISRTASLAQGVMIGPLSYVGEGVKIEADTFIGSHVSVGRNTQIDRGCDVAAGVKIGSEVIIEKNVFIGLNATIHNGIKLSEGAVILSGSTVFQSVKKGESVMGNPAQTIKK